MISIHAMWLVKNGNAMFQNGRLRKPGVVRYKSKTSSRSYRLEALEKWREKCYLSLEVRIGYDPTYTDFWVPRKWQHEVPTWN
jgi:hypothetical protein